jgi:hypothetical protein
MSAPGDARAEGTGKSARRSFLLIVVVCLVGTSGIILPVLWFLYAPQSAGETRTSPDDRFMAEAVTRRKLTHFFTREEYVEITVTEIASGREVWRVVHRYQPKAEVPDYGLRGVRFLKWADDSSAVMIDVDGRQMTFPVP